MITDGVTYTVEIVRKWWSGYWVVTYADGREGVRVGPYRNRHEAEETAELQRNAYGVKA